MRKSLGISTAGGFKLVVMLMIIVSIIAPGGVLLYLRHDRAVKIRSYYFNDEFAQGGYVAQGIPYSLRSNEALAWSALNLERSNRDSAAAALISYIQSRRASRYWTSFASAGRLLFNKDHALEALAYSKEVIDAKPDDESALWLRAETFRTRRRFADALHLMSFHRRELVSSVVLLSTLETIYLDMARSSSRKIRFERFAIHAFQAARALEPENPRPYYVFGRYEFEIGRAHAAVALLAHAASMSSSEGIHSVYWTALQQDESIGDAERRQLIITDARKLLARNSDFPSIWLAVADALQQQGAENEAAGIKAELRRRYPMSPEAAIEQLRTTRTYR